MKNLFQPTRFGTQKKKRTLTSADKKRIAAHQKWKCKMCGMVLKARYHIDHIKPFSQGGSDKESNLQALCSNCHDEKTEHERHQKKQKKIKQTEREHQDLYDRLGLGLSQKTRKQKSSSDLDWLIGKPKSKKKKNDYGFGNFGI